MPTTDPGPAGTPARRSELGRVHRGVIVLVSVLVVVAGVGVLVRRGVGPLPDPEGCHAAVEGVSVDLSTEQAENAALIAAIGVRRGLPARAVSIALATAFQESKLRNLDHGDRDSVGLFQQRPSMGWGSATQIADPYYATGRFYDALVKVSGYEQMRITVAAQRVQRSGFPEAYAVHESESRVLASALTGYSPAALTCVVQAPSKFSGLVVQQPGGNRLTARAEAVRRDVRRAFGPQSYGRITRARASTGQQGSASQEGRALDISLRPVDAAGTRTGWSIAQYLVAHANRLAIDSVAFDGKVWRAGPASEQGWRAADSGGGPRRDRVSVEVVRGG